MLSPKQNEFIRNADHRWNLKVGAVRSGKSYVDVDFMIPYRLRQVRGKDGLSVILGVSRETIERNVLQPMRERYTDRLIGTINGRNIAKICGEDVYCLGAEKVSQVAKIQGSSIKYCYGDEIAKWHKEVFVMLQSRLDKPYSCFDGACNPEYPTHWLKGFIDRTDIDAYVQKYTIFDNPFLPKDYVENICKEYEGTVYYRRYILGEWAMAEGLIYPMWEEAKTDDLPQEYKEYVLSIDYGTRNAFAAILWGLNDGIWYAIDEYYYSGRDSGADKDDSVYADDLDKFTAYLFDNEKIADKLETIIDPSAASFIAMLKKRGRYKVRKADNAVADGIRETATAMKMGKIKISARTPNLIKEIQGYVWDDTKGDDVPLKVNDHAMDAMRYFVKTKHVMREKSRYNGILL